MTITEGALRIALVAPPWLPVPPVAYGGIERVVAWLADALVERGHDVTVIAAGEGGTAAKHLATYPTPPRERLGTALPETVHGLSAHLLASKLDVDVIHDHSLVGPLLCQSRTAPTVVTAHGPVVGDLAAYYRQLPELGASLVAISRAQQRMAPLPWSGMVHNAIPVDTYPFRQEKEKYCAFVGRMSPEKAPDLAVVAAREAGLPIRIAAKCNEPPEKAYFEQRVQPLLGSGVEWLGELSEPDKVELLAGASCLIAPVQWAEPFGLVLVEAMACGTPVVAIGAGAIPEIVVDGVTGFVCDTPGSLPSAIRLAEHLDRGTCRQWVAERFDLSRMAVGYESVYRRALAERTVAV